MKLSDFINTKILQVYSDVNTFGKGDKILLLFEGGTAILINKFWGEYFTLEEIQKIQLSSFSKLDVLGEHITLQNIVTIEGVCTIVKLSNKTFIYLYEQIEDMERFAYYNTIRVIEHNNEEHSDLLENLKDAEEMVLSRWVSTENKLSQSKG